MARQLVWIPALALLSAVIAAAAADGLEFFEREVRSRAQPLLL